MDKQVRNTTEIVRLAKQKSQKTREKVDKAISKFSIEGKAINFIRTNSREIKHFSKKIWRRSLYSKKS